MTPAALETVYETLARELDKLDEEKHKLLLAKLALLLFQDIDDVELACRRINEAARNLDV